MPVVQRQNADVLSRIARFVRVATARLVEDFINKGKSHLMSSGSPSEVSQDVTMAAVFLKTTSVFTWCSVLHGKTAGLSTLDVPSSV